MDKPELVKMVAVAALVAAGGDPQLETAIELARGTEHTIFSKPKKQENK